ncbi:MAG: ABC transporter ATP-binding protein [Desulfurococcaceae archaeon]|jgi:ABC-2 type transport system ATP-binding protein|nr:ABC transporter ATP-binding protein [Desulfurococcaceae archaeon]
MSSGVAVEVRNLTKVYGGGVVGVSDLTFAIREGEIYGLIGPNGSGKTTTLRIIATLIKPTSGFAKVFGVDVVKEPLKVRQLVNYLPEEAGAYRDLTGYDFIRFMLSLRFSGRRLEEAVSEAIEIAGLGNALKRPVRTYSKGMKRLLALSTVLASRPRLLILDEPTTGLDVERSIQVRQIIARYNREYGITVLLSSHNMLEVENLCHRVGILYRGKLVAEGSVEELKVRTGSRNLEEVFMRVRG